MGYLAFDRRRTSFSELLSQRRQQIQASQAHAPLAGAEAAGAAGLPGHVPGPAAEAGGGTDASAGLGHGLECVAWEADSAEAEGIKGTVVATLEPAATVEKQGAEPGQKRKLSEAAFTNLASLAANSTLEKDELVSLAPADAIDMPEAERLAEEEGLTLHRANNTTGYRGVYLKCRGGEGGTGKRTRPYEVKLSRGSGSAVAVTRLGQYASLGQAALCYARAVEALIMESCLHE